MPESKYYNFEKWLREQTWKNVTDVETVDEKAATLQNMSIKAMNIFFPEKDVIFTSDDQPWMDSRIKTEIRKRQRIYSKHRKSRLGRKKRYCCETYLKSQTKLHHKTN